MHASLLYLLFFNTNTVSIIFQKSVTRKLYADVIRLHSCNTILHADSSQIYMRPLNAYLLGVHQTRQLVIATNKMFYDCSQKYQYLYPSTHAYIPNISDHACADSIHEHQTFSE